RRRSRGAGPRPPGARLHPPGEEPRPPGARPCPSVPAPGRPAPNRGRKFDICFARLNFRASNLTGITGVREEWSGAIKNSSRAVVALRGRPRMWKGRVRYAALLLLDASMAAFAVSAALHLRFDGNVPSIYWSQLPTIIPLFVVVRIASLWVFRAYTSLWRYATLREALAGGAGVALGSVLLFTLAMTTSVIRLPRSVFAIEALLFAFAAGAPRFAVRWRRA